MHRLLHFFKYIIFVLKKNIPPHKTIKIKIITYKPNNIEYVLLLKIKI